ncbi:type I restriction-modification system subunit M [Candidatus Epulonipiscium fishelsonii]|uniref:Type I restriction-modification system subunit M n=1 Tax=Candidatus Epulonipiscium fishelsonii TaxID=77094 RepID=A0ACC8XFZ1_9FIRM|nr:type I restriction-modification system subunit M [Epulopiscium sp. SCG-B11WGA-EpuloA1]
MSQNNREQERAELHRSIWTIANELRGNIDGWDFKQYVLGILFYRYISENITNYINQDEHEAGNTDFDYANLSDKYAETIREDMIQTKGFFILPSELFCNVQKNAEQNENLNETLANVFKSIEHSAIGSESESNFKGLFDDIDVNSNRLGGTVAERNERLVALLDGIAEMQLNNSMDEFGDAYEYLLAMYASGAGKSGGEFFTPQEVSELLTRITLVGKTEVNKVYDPCCGSGSLLLNFAKILGKENVINGFYGQEINLTTYNLCRINMFLHDIEFANFNITHGNTLTNPMNEADEPFDAIVSNPPYSVKWEGNDSSVLIDDPRFSPAGVLAPRSKADLAFVMHSLYWLAEGARAAIVCFPGIMYRSGAEKQIRKYLVENNYIESIIQLPANLFFGTSISTCIMVLKKGKLDNNVLFIDASKEFKRVTNNNKLEPNNIEHILNTFEARENKQYLSYLANVAEIAQNAYNLSVSMYVEKEDTKQAVDISVLNKKIEYIADRQQTLRKEIDTIIVEINLDVVS